MREAYKGSTSHSEFFYIQDSTTGLPKTGLVYTDMTGSYTRAGALRTSVTMATLAAANSAWSSGGFKEVDSTNEPGLYRWDIPDAAYATGVDNFVAYLKATGVVCTPKEFRLVDWNNQATIAANVLQATTDVTEPSSVPAWSASLGAKLAWMFAVMRNKLTQTSTTKTLRNNADSSDIATASVSDDGTTFTHDKWQ